ncbi:MAG: hypothetical protein ABS939_00690 [Psychrobacillus sp.]
MHSAKLSNGKVVTALEYDELVHGVRLFCMDMTCGVPILHIPKSDDVTAHFRTSGRGESIHKPTCGFAKQLTFQETVEKVSEYQVSLRENGVREFVVRLNLKSIDPDYEAREVSREPNEKDKRDKPELDSKALKESKPTPASISSLKSVKKLFTSTEPDLLASIILSVNGKRIPISQLIKSTPDAHETLWNNNALDLPYFIHGKVQKVIKLTKVWYINFEVINQCNFTLVVFEKHFKHFTFQEDDLVGKEILAYGYLRKNSFKPERPVTEMLIKSNKYIEFI